MNEKRKLCGFRPTGRLHLGHFFSVVLPARDGDVDVLVADYHAPEAPAADAYECISTLVRLGVPRCRIVRQSDQFRASLFASFLSLATVSRLEGLTQYRATPEQKRNAQMLVYPVMMAVDVAGYDEVLVGEDQEQHLEFARDLIARYNLRFNFGEVRPATESEIPLPKAKVVGGRIRDLRNPSKKMSKSSPEGCLFLDDSPEEIRRKIKRATTTREGLENLEFLYREFVGGEPPALASELKTQLADAIIRAICPVEVPQCTA